MPIKKFINNAVIFIRTKVASIGQNIQFVAFFAHAGVAVFLVEHVNFNHPFDMMSLIIVGAGIKEFYFDARYEKDPPQTFMDNLQDFIGWAVGAVVGYLYIV